MTITQAIEQRYNRFDNLWMKATGHKFTEDAEWCKQQEEKETKLWEQKLNPILKKHNFSSIEDYDKSLIWEEGGINGDYCTNRITEIDELVKQKPHYSSLFPYEKFCIEEAAKLARWVLQDKGTYWWNINVGGKSIYDVDKLLKDNGFNINDGHSNNSIGTTITFAHCLITTPELFQYMHGAMVYLVGDKEYHDDRSDIPQEYNPKTEEPKKTMTVRELINELKKCNPDALVGFEHIYITYVSKQYDDYVDLGGS